MEQGERGDKRPVGLGCEHNPYETPENPDGLLQKTLIFILACTNCLLLSVLRPVIHAAELPNPTRSVPPPFKHPEARHQPWLYPSLSSTLQNLL